MQQALATAALVTATLALGCGGPAVPERQPQSEPTAGAESTDGRDADTAPAASTAEVAEVDALAIDRPRAPGMVVHAIDVGQGAATLIEFPCAAVLVDTGGEATADYHSTQPLIDYLDRFFERRSDLERTLAVLYITHPHIDHTRGIREIVAHFTIENVVTDGLERGSGGPQQRFLHGWAASNDVPLERISTRDLPEGDALTSDIIDPVSCDELDPVLRVLWGAVPRRPAAWNAGAFASENNHSIVLRVDAGEASVLISGDLQDAGIESLIARYEETDLLDVDVYEVGHHGSHNGTTVPFLDVMTPEIALLACGPATERDGYSAYTHGHPRSDIIEMLVTAIARPRSAASTVMVATGQRTFVEYEMQRAVYATGWDGDVRVTGYTDGSFRVTSGSE